MRLFRPDTRMRRRLQKKKEIRQLESKRDQMIDRGLMKRAQAIEAQISNLKKDIKRIENE